MGLRRAVASVAGAISRLVRSVMVFSMDWAIGSNFSRIILLKVLSEMASTVISLLIGEFHIFVNRRHNRNEQSEAD